MAVCAPPACCRPLAPARPAYPCWRPVRCAAAAPRSPPPARPAAGRCENRKRLPQTCLSLPRRERGTNAGRMQAGCQEVNLAWQRVPASVHCNTPKQRPGRRPGRTCRGVQGVGVQQHLQHLQHLRQGHQQRHLQQAAAARADNSSIPSTCDASSGWVRHGGGGTLSKQRREQSEAWHAGRDTGCAAARTCSCSPLSPPSSSACQRRGGATEEEPLVQCMTSKQQVMQADISCTPCECRTRCFHPAAPAPAAQTARRPPRSAGSRAAARGRAAHLPAGCLRRAWQERQEHSGSKRERSELGA